MRKRDKTAVVRADGCYRVYKGGVEVRADQLRSPAKTFAAQVCRLVPFGRAYLLYFGQVLPPTPRLSSLIAVQLNDSALRDFQSTLLPHFRESVARLSGEALEDDLGFADSELRDIPRERTATFNATIGRVVVSNLGAQIDWYDLTPRQIHLLNSSQGSVEPPAPVVTIALSNALLQRLIDLVDERLGPPEFFSDEEEPAEESRGGA